MNANLKNKKTIALLITVAVMAVALISFTLAMLNHRSQAATNEFSGATVNIGVVEGEGGKVYEDGIDNKNINEFDPIKSGQEAAKIVAIKNIYSKEYPTSDTYVRVRLVPCLRYVEDKEEAAQGRHEVKGELVPVDMKGKVTYSALGENWVKGPQNAETDDAYYYYTIPLKPDQVTSNLIETVTYSSDLPDNTYFELQVLTEGVSAKQDGAAKQAWGNNIPELQKSAPSADTTTTE